MEATQSHAVEKNRLINMLKGLIFNTHNIKYFIIVQYFMFVLLLIFWVFKLAFIYSLWVSLKIRYNTN